MHGLCASLILVKIKISEREERLKRPYCVHSLVRLCLPVSSSNPERVRRINRRAVSVMTHERRPRTSSEIRIGISTHGEEPARKQRVRHAHLPDADVPAAAPCTSDAATQIAAYHLVPKQMPRLCFRAVSRTSRLSPPPPPRPNMKYPLPPALRAGQAPRTWS